ncbi:hypothetical protein D3C84_682450 [compost metagenome]
MNSNQRDTTFAELSCQIYFKLVVPHGQSMELTAEALRKAIDAKLEELRGTERLLPGPAIVRVAKCSP